MRSGEQLPCDAGLRLPLGGEWLQQQEFLEAIRHRDETEPRFLIEAVERSVRGEEALEVELVRCKQVI